MSEVLAHLYDGPPIRVAAYDRSPPAQNEITTQVAIVDRIPFPYGQSSGCPGFSLALDSVAPSASRSLLKDTEERPQPPLIVVQAGLTAGTGPLVMFSPSNTMFINGKTSTMFTESWSRTHSSQGEYHFEMAGPRVDRNVLAWALPSECTSIRVPLQKLTERREIALSMGNIVSKLVATDGSGTQPASLELEGKISTLVKDKKLVNSRLVVFALISHSSGPQHSAAALDVRAGSDSLGIAIQDGARLFRVTGGGGGWGNKQGLLALEPVESASDLQTASTVLEATNIDALLDRGEALPSESAMDSIAPPGAFIQFHAALLSQQSELELLKDDYKNLTSDQTDSSPPTVDSHGNVNFLFGSIPSNELYGPNDPKKLLGNDPITIPNHFGMLSEGTGLLKVPNKNSLIDGTWGRFDAPHALLTCHKVEY